MSQNFGFYLLNPGGSTPLNNITAPGAIKSNSTVPKTPGKLRRINVQVVGTAGAYSFYDCNFQGAFSDSVQYQTGQGVTFDGNVFLCIAPTLGPTTWTEPSSTFTASRSRSGSHATPSTVPVTSTSNGPARKRQRVLVRCTTWASTLPLSSRNVAPARPSSSTRWRRASLPVAAWHRWAVRGHGAVARHVIGSRAALAGDQGRVRHQQVAGAIEVEPEWATAD